MSDDASALSVAVCSIAATRRRRFLWAAWWSGPPSPHPFRKPDAHGGGARSEEEAHHQAQAATGRSLVRIDGRWARAWSRIMQGEPAFRRPPVARVGEEAPVAEHGTGDPARRAAEPPTSTWALLGVARTATLDEIKRAYRKRALESHPDQGGDPEAFRALLRAYERAVARHRRPARRGR
jgi:hypothetical protein